MKNRKAVLSVVIAVAMILGGLIVFTNYKINQGIDRIAEKESELKNEVYSQPGFSDPFADIGGEDNTLDVRTMHRVEFEKMTGLVECPDSHMDIYKSDIEAFLDASVDEWEPCDWYKIDDHYYVVDYKDGTSSYRRETTYFSESDTRANCEVRVGLDAVSERVHNINFMLPFADNSKKAFTETLIWLGIDETEAETIFDKMMEGIHKLGENERIEYEAYGYRFYIGEWDYTGSGKVDKAYNMSISSAEDK